MFETKRRRLDLSMDMIPLINVIFLLLIFFLITGNVEKLDTIAVDLPEADTGSQGAPHHTTIYLDAAGNIAINEDFVKKHDVAFLVKTILLEHPNSDITLKADKDLSAKELLWMMNHIEAAGGKNITLVAEFKPQALQ